MFYTSNQNRLDNHSEDDFLSLYYSILVSSAVVGVKATLFLVAGFTLQVKFHRQLF